MVYGQVYVRARQRRYRLDAPVVYLVATRVLHATYLARDAGQFAVVAKLYPRRTNAFCVHRAEDVRQEAPLQILPHLRVLDPNARDEMGVAQRLVRHRIGRQCEKLVAVRRVVHHPAHFHAVKAKGIGYRV